MQIGERRSDRDVVGRVRLQRRRWHNGQHAGCAPLDRAEHRRRGVASALLQRLLSALGDDARGVGLINVLAQDRGMATFLSQQGFQNTIRQYEMVLDFA